MVRKIQTSEYELRCFREGYTAEELKRDAL